MSPVGGGGTECGAAVADLVPVAFADYEARFPQD
jgi:hypothetical protein